MKQKYVKNNKYLIEGKNGWEEFEGLVKSYKKNIKLYTFYTNKFNTISCTGDHQLYLNIDTPIKAKYINEGTSIFTKNGYEKVVRIKSSYTDEVIDVVKSDSNMFYANGFLTHNCDEFGFVQRNMADDFWESNYPTISSSKNSKIIIISTPNGSNNLFYKVYNEAEKDINAFKHMRITWEHVPGRDEAWKNIQMKNMTEDQFRQEFNCEFILGNVQTVISSGGLQTLYKNKQETPYITELGGTLRVYERPESGAMYIIGVDPSKGTGLHDAGIQVMKIVKEDKKVRFQQVAVFQDNRTEPHKFSGIVSRLSIYYNDALIMCENNGEGSAVVHHLWWTYENQNLYNTGQKEKSLGVRASKGTKERAVLSMKKLAEAGDLLIYDPQTLAELSEFIEDDDGKMHGRDFSDDLVSALYWACYALTLDVHDDDIDIYTETEVDNEEEIWGFLSDINPSNGIEKFW